MTNNQPTGQLLGHPGRDGGDQPDGGTLLTMTLYNMYSDDSNAAAIKIINVLCVRYPALHFIRGAYCGIKD